MRHIPFLHWRMKLSSGMYGDEAVDCATEGCEYTCYTCASAIFLMRLFGRLPWRIEL